MNKKRQLSWSFLRHACLLPLLLWLPQSHAEFGLNFQQLDPGATLADSIANVGCADGQSTNGGHHRADMSCSGGYFMQEIVNDGTNDYYHVIIGDPDEDFAQEYFIQGGWGTWLGYSDYPLSASEGGLNGGADAKPANMGIEFVSPLAETALSGSGTGAPHRVTFRQIIRGAGFEQEVLKEFYDKKIKATQTITDDELVSTFIVDMSAIGYADSSTNGTMVNTMTVTDKVSGDVYTDFDIHDQNNDAYIANARYIHTGGIPFKGSNGNYVYEAGGEFDVYSVDWSAYRNADENVPDI